MRFIVTMKIPDIICRCFHHQRFITLLEKTPWIFLGLSLSGWLLFVIGFALTNHSTQLSDWLGAQFKGRAQSLFFSFWLCCFLGVCLYIAAVLHLVLRRWFTAILLHALTAVYLISSGASLITEVILNRLTLDFLSQTQPLWNYVQLEMAGCIISFAALVIFMTLWPLLSVHPLPAFILSLRSHSFSQSHPDTTLIESGSHQPDKREGDTSQKFTVTNTSVVMSDGETTAGTQQEKTALLLDKN